MTFSEVEVAGDGCGIDAQALGVDVRRGFRGGDQPAEKGGANLWTRCLLIRIGQGLGTGLIMQHLEFCWFQVGVEASLRQFDELRFVDLVEQDHWSDCLSMEL